MDHKITPEAKELWLPQLEGGTLPQATHALYDGYGYCCLGVFARAKGASFFEADDDDEAASITGKTEFICDLAGVDLNNNETLDLGFAEQFGLTSNVQAFLSTMNDGTHEVLIRNEDPLYHLYEKHATKVLKPTHSASALIQEAGAFFSVKPHTFAEIAKIIREDL
jgi:hypothetical protein